MYNKLLLATDLAKGSHRLAIKASQIANNFQAELYIIHVLELPFASQYAQALGFAELATPPIEEASCVLATLADEIGIPEEKQIVIAGRSAYHIIEQAKSLSIDAIIIGSHSSSALPNFLGSTANAISHQSPCDVVTLRMDG